MCGHYDYKCCCYKFSGTVRQWGAVSVSSCSDSHSMVIGNCTFTNNKCGGTGGAVSYNAVDSESITCSVLCIILTVSVTAGTYFVKEIDDDNLFIKKIVIQ